MANKYVKRSYRSAVIRRIQIQRKCLFTTTKTAKVKNVGRRELSTARGYYAGSTCLDSF